MRAVCEIALIADDLFLGRPIEEVPVMVVAGMPVPALAGLPIPPPVTAAREPPAVVASLDPLYIEARMAASRARAALAKAIEAKGSRYTRRKIEKGNERLDRGIEALATRHDSASLRAAIQDFREAEKIYLEAQETSWLKEHNKPKLRVH